MKINGFVEIESAYLNSLCLGALIAIKTEKENMKAEFISSWREWYNNPSWYERKFGKFRPEVSDDEAWELLNKKAAKEGGMFAWIPKNWVDNTGVERSRDIKQLMAAAKVVDKVLVNTDLAAMLYNMNKGE